MRSRRGLSRGASATGGAGGAGGRRRAVPPAFVDAAPREIRLKLTADLSVRPKLQVVCGSADSFFGAVPHRLHKSIVDVDEPMLVSRSDDGRNGRESERLGKALLALFHRDLRLMTVFKIGEGEQHAWLGAKLERLPCPMT